MTNNFAISGDYKEYAGSLSLSLQNMKENIKKYSTSCSYTEAKCFQYSMGYGGTTLGSWFTKGVAALPSEYNEITKS
jgi:hypothetical protein